MVWFSSVQSLSYVQLFATPWNRSTPGLPVHHQLPVDVIKWEKNKESHYMLQIIVFDTQKRYLMNLF